MERREGPQTPFEVYCYHCNVTFAAGTKRCIHCGRRMGARPGAESAVAEPPELEATVEPGLGRRFGGMSLWVLLAIGAAISRVCSEG